VEPREDFEAGPVVPLGNLSAKEKRLLIVALQRLYTLTGDNNVSQDFTDAVITGDIPPAVASIVRAYRRDAGAIELESFEAMIKGDLDVDVEKTWLLLHFRLRECALQWMCVRSPSIPLWRCHPTCLSGGGL
jgi:hypothetical protein